MSTFEQLIQRYPSATYKKGQSILLKNDTPSSVYVIERGLVKAYTITPDGAERQISIHSRNDDLPVGLGLGLTHRSEYFYQAYSDCAVRIIPLPAFVKIIRQDTDTLFKQYTRLNSQLMSSFARVSALEHPRAGDKVAFMLLNMANQFGTRLRPSTTRFRLAMTQQEMADALGLTRETTGIELKKLELKQVITHSRKNYVLYMERLRSYLEGR